jgi:TonB family protein
VATFGKLLVAMAVLCASLLAHSQEAHQEGQQSAPRPWAAPESADAVLNADASSAFNGLSTLTSTSTHASPAIAEVKDSFKIYTALVGTQALPTNGKWTVPSTPVLAFLPACKEWKASCLEVEYSVPSRNIICHWTVLFPAPVMVKGKQVQTPTTINEDRNAAEYTMMVRLQTGMNYATVTTQAPVYPAAAKAVDWTGSVSVDIVVSPQGKVVSIPGVRGPAMLQASAKQAVAKWVYTPTRLGSQNVARAFTVQVNYSVGGATVKRK